MRLFGIVTKPSEETLKSEVVAFPPALVVEAMSKRLVKEPGVSWIESFAYGGKVPMIEVEVPM